MIFVFDRVENIVGKGENAGYQHFLLFPQCFENTSLQDTSKGVIVWERVKEKSREDEANRVGSIFMHSAICVLFCSIF